MSEENRPGRRMKPVADDVPSVRREFAQSLRDLIERSLPEHTPAGVLAPLVPIAKSSLFHYLSGRRLPSRGMLEALLDVCATVKAAPETLQLPPDEIEGGIERIKADDGQVAKFLEALEAAHSHSEVHFLSPSAGSGLPDRVHRRAVTSSDRSVALALTGTRRMADKKSQDYRALAARVGLEPTGESTEGTMSVTEAMRAVREAQRRVQESTAELGRAHDSLARALADLESLKGEFEAFREQYEADTARRRLQALLVEAEELWRADDDALARRLATISVVGLHGLHERLDQADAEPDPETRRRALQEVYRLLEEREKAAASIRKAAR
ncbi:hypothetical protein OG851_42695 (plasmid) [Streptomyces sp. NBC_00161]|uniref:hypothetical protein n=1 Tax=Streptomyces sp. NBC_00161 TaxID=2975671 RepID=UPI0032471967